MMTIKATWVETKNKLWTNNYSAGILIRIWLLIGLEYYHFHLFLPYLLVCYQYESGWFFTNLSTWLSLDMKVTSVPTFMPYLKLSWLLQIKFSQSVEVLMSFWLLFVMFTNQTRLQAQAAGVPYHDLCRTSCFESNTVCFYTDLLKMFDILPCMGNTNICYWLVIIYTYIYSIYYENGPWVLDPNVFLKPPVWIHCEWACAVIWFISALWYTCIQTWNWIFLFLKHMVIFNVSKLKLASVNWSLNLYKLPWT